MARERDEGYTDEPRRRRRDEDEDEGYTDAPPPRRRRDEDEEGDAPDIRRGGPRMSATALRTVAWSQKIIIFCILGELGTIPVRLVLSQMPPEMQLLGALLLLAYYLVVGITATVFVFRMALAVYSTGTGVLLGILTLIPCIGLIVLLVINGKATTILKNNGVRVGFLGANMADLP
jgi:hypothetical protein